MFQGVATIEEGMNTYEVRTKICDTIRDVVREVAKLGKDGRIATCNIWMKAKKSWTCVKSVEV